MIRFSKDLLQNPDEAARREWLETNGIGGFASSTIAGVNTRRYHGLLTAALRPPSGRFVLLSKLEETLIIEGRRHELSTNHYSGAVHPHGYTYVESFRLDPFPVWTFSADGIDLEKSVFMVHGSNTTVIQYRLANSALVPVQLELRPLAAFRDYHALTHENGALDPAIQVHSENLVSFYPYAGLPRLYFAHDHAALLPEGYWYRNFEYLIERERGLDFVEDLFNPFTMRIDLTAKHGASVITSTMAHDIRTVETLRETEIQRRAQLADHVPPENELLRTLTAAADQYIVNRGPEKTIIAGYHWFTDWGRDTMIALPGLTLGTKRYDVAQSILKEFAGHVDQGMLPNRFPDAGETPEYNTIDATLWYFEAVRALLQHTGNYEFVRAHLHSVLGNIIDWHLRGTRYGIKMDDDGLLASGDPAVQLTWMDAKIGDWVVTPRNGKAVEVQALWYNALRTMEDIAVKYGDPACVKYAAIADRAQRSFNDQFWNETSGTLFDTVNGEQRDSTMRPNQILAVSLTHSMLGRERARSVVTAVETELFVPFGLHSLSPADARYRGRYEGDSVSRDSSYHQGPVWAWLLGPFITAYLKVNGTGKKSLAQVQSWLEVVSRHLTESCVGHISEIFDGDPPHRPRGCAAQAWSVAEILRVAADLNATARTKAARSK